MLNYSADIDSVSDSAIFTVTNVNPIMGTWSDDGIRLKMNISNIRYVNNMTPWQDRLQSAGIAIIGFSVITTLLVAPLVSIDYKHGEIRSQRYFKWAGAGLIGIGVGIPLILSGRGKKYNVLPRYAPPQKDYWYIEKQRD